MVHPASTSPIPSTASSVMDGIRAGIADRIKYGALEKDTGNLSNRGVFRGFKLTGIAVANAIAIPFILAIIIPLGVLISGGILGRSLFVKDKDEALRYRVFAGFTFANSIGLLVGVCIKVIRACIGIFYPPAYFATTELSQTADQHPSPPRFTFFPSPSSPWHFTSLPSPLPPPLSRDSWTPLERICYGILGLPDPTKINQPKVSKALPNAEDEYDVYQLLERREYVLEDATKEMLVKQMFLASQSGQQGKDFSDFNVAEVDHNAIAASHGSNYNLSIEPANGNIAHSIGGGMATLLGAKENGKISYFGICEGHNDGMCSREFSKFRTSLLTRLQNYWRRETPLTSIANALKAVFVDFDSEFQDPNYYPGSTTALVVLIVDGYVWMANAGDSRALLVLPDATVQLTDDAITGGGIGRFDASIKRRGGEIGEQQRVARGIGFKRENRCSPRPKLTCLRLEDIPPDAKLVMATSGLWKVASSRQIGEAVRQGASAETLIASARTSGATGDLGALVINIK